MATFFKAVAIFALLTSVLGCGQYSKSCTHCLRSGCVYVTYKVGSRCQSQPDYKIKIRVIYFEASQCPVVFPTTPKVSTTEYSQLITTSPDSSFTQSSIETTVRSADTAKGETTTKIPSTEIVPTETVKMISSTSSDIASTMTEYMPTERGEHVITSEDVPSGEILITGTGISEPSTTETSTAPIETITTEIAIITTTTESLTSETSTATTETSSTETATTSTTETLTTVETRRQEQSPQTSSTEYYIPVTTTAVTPTTQSSGVSEKGRERRFLKKRIFLAGLMMLFAIFMKLLINC